MFVGRFGIVKGLGRVGRVAIDEANRGVQIWRAIRRGLPRGSLVFRISRLVASMDARRLDGEGALFGCDLGRTRRP